MTTCFRSVPNKLFCASYFKAANVIHSENTVNLRPPKQISAEKWNCLLIQNQSLIPGYKSLYADDLYFKQNYLHPSYSVENSSLHQLIIQYNRESLLKCSDLNNKQNLVLRSNSTSDEKSDKKSEPESSTEGRPSEEQLEKVFEELSTSLPTVFSKTLNFENYHSKIILENNFKNKRTVGLEKYVFQLALLKALAHWKFAFVKLEILKITKHPEDGTIKCRWRVVGIPGMSVFFQFWKYTPTKLQNIVNEAPTWIDGFSIYHVGNDGKIIKHILDKMQPDDDRVKFDGKNRIAPKVAMFLGLLNGPEEALMCVPSDRKKDSFLSRILRPSKKIQ